MKTRRSRYHGHRFPAEIIGHAVWLYHRFCLSFRDVEDLLAERGIIVSYETIRHWCRKFGSAYVRKLKGRRNRLGDIWHLDELFLRINGQQQYLWRAVDQDGDVIDILVQPRRDQRSAERFFRRLLRSQGKQPFRIVTDKLKSYAAAKLMKSAAGFVHAMMGTKLAQYQITAHLGSGGMGDVYQATDTKLGRSVAIKFLLEAFSHDTERVARFQRETRELASLNHSNIAAIHGLEEIKGPHFLVMELVTGETLAEKIKHRAIPIEEALSIGKQIAEALEEAHEKGIHHCDLKPANIKLAVGDHTDRKGFWRCSDT